jgi:hypothetical protein
MNSPVVSHRRRRARRRQLLERVPEERRPFIEFGAGEEAADKLRPYLEAGFTGFTFNNNSTTTLRRSPRWRSTAPDRRLTPPWQRATGRAGPSRSTGAVVANLGIALAKFVAAAITGSSAMLSEAIHTVCRHRQPGAPAVGIRGQSLPPDDTHDFGHGKELYFWSLVVAIVLFGVGGGLAFYEGIQHFIDPHPIESPIVSYVVLIIAFVLGGQFLEHRLA